MLARPRASLPARGSLAWVLLISAQLACAGADDSPLVANGGVNNGAGDSGLPQGAPPDAAGGPPPVGAPDGGVVVTPGGDGGCGAVKAETQPVRGKVDVVWVIDDSGSMLPQVLPVGENMTQFMQTVRQSGGDISVVMVTGPIIGTYLQGLITDTNYHWSLQPVQSWDAFQWAINAYPAYQQFLRPDATLHYIFVSDDMSNMASADFLSAMQATVNRPFKSHAVATDGLAGPCIGAGIGPAGGIAYFEAAQATGGEQLKLCDDWGAGFDKLQSNVVASLPLPCDYPIPPPPSGETLDPRAVQVLYTAPGAAASQFALTDDAAKCGENLAWRYDNPAAPTTVLLCPKACEAVKAGGTVELGFGCAPVLLK